MIIKNPGNKTVPAKVVTTCTEDGDKHYQSRHCAIDPKDEGT